MFTPAVRLTRLGRKCISPRQRRIWLLLLIGWTYLFTVSPGMAAPLADNHICPIQALNSNFEQDTADWQGTRGQVSLRTPDPLNSGNVMRIGNVSPPDVIGESEVRSRPIPLPNNATSITLRFRLYRVIAPPGNAGQDLQKLLIEDQNGNRREYIADRKDDETWMLSPPISLLEYRGQPSIRVIFSVYNDGVQGLTSMYVDDVVIEYCTPTPTPTTTATMTATGTVTPTPTPSVTPTQRPVAPCIPLPLNCQNVVVNSEFEYEGDWVCGADPVPADYTSEQYFGGRWSMLLGNPPDGPNVTSYSSVRQLVSIPANATLAHLCFQRLYRSEDTLLTRPGPNHDRQEVIALEPDLDVIEVLYRENRNENTGWQQQGISLNRYIGRTFYLYFNVYNNASPQHTWMYLDNVELFVCTAAPPPPPATATPQPVVVLTPATPVPPTLAPPSPTVTTVVTAAAALALPTLVLVPDRPVLVEPLATPLNGDGAVVAIATNTPLVANQQPLPTLTPLVRSTPLTETINWSRGLGAIAIMAGVLVMIGLIFLLAREIWRMFRRRSDPYA